jgi:hypothetical protein
VDAREHKEVRIKRAALVAVSAMVSAVIAGSAGTGVAVAADPVIAAAGDISDSCAAGSPPAGAMGTSDLLVNQGLTAVLTLGDNQYGSGELTNFNNCYHPTWGRVKSITRPSPGNHDPCPGSGYDDYFGSRAPGCWYSFDIGAWHFISLDSNRPSDPAQLAFLDADLASTTKKCVAAYWHHPMFSSSSAHGSDSRTRPFWDRLYAANADLVLGGHDHTYERFAPQTPSGQRDDARGLREFVVGTGGRSHYGFDAPIANSQVRNASAFGVLKLTLHADSYDWRFVPEAGGTFSDSGSETCSSAAPPPPSDTQIFAPAADARVEEAAPSTNYETSFLRAEGGADPDVESYLRFNVSGVSGTVSTAKLRVYAYDASVNGPAVYRTGNAWTEAGITWSNRPARTSGATDDKGPIAANTWLVYDVTPFISGDGTYSFVLATTSADRVDMYSREAATLRPRLVVVGFG